MKRVGIMTIRDIHRHRHDLGLARAQVAVGVSAGTVSNVLERAAAAGLTWPLPPDLDDAALHARLYPRSPPAPVPLRVTVATGARLLTAAE